MGSNKDKDVTPWLYKHLVGILGLTEILEPEALKRVHEDLGNEIRLTLETGRKRRGRPKQPTWNEEGFEIQIQESPHLVAFIIVDWTSKCMFAFLAAMKIRGIANSPLELRVSVNPKTSPSEESLQEEAIEEMYRQAYSTRRTRAATTKERFEYWSLMKKGDTAAMEALRNRLVLPPGQGRRAQIDTVRLVGEFMEVYSGIGRLTVARSRVLVSDILKVWGIESERSATWTDSGVRDLHERYRAEVRSGRRRSITPDRIDPRWRKVPINGSTQRAPRRTSGGYKERLRQSLRDYED